MDFMKYKWLYFLISSLVLVPGIFSLIKWGLKPSIDFTGGSVVELRIKDYRYSAKDNDKFSEIYNKNGVQLSSLTSTGDNTVILKSKTIDQAKNNDILKGISESFAQAQEVRFETVGPLLGAELIRKTILAVILATGFILFYIAYSFHDKRYGLCATVATLHDSLVILGIFSLLGHFKGVEIDTLFVTAVLTSLSFSVHDTVVVYDRIRESIKRFPKARYVDLVNKALSETMGRSVNNSLTIIFMLTCLWLLGGETIRWFVFALLVGAITGTYSSPFVATPLLVIWHNFKNRGRKN